MKTQPLPTLTNRGNILRPMIMAGALILSPVILHAQGSPKANPASKVYVADVSGEAIIGTGDSIVDLIKRSVYSAQGTVIETKKPVSASDRNKYFSTMVYSNGTGAFFDADTRIEMKRFVQEPFTATQTDLEIEPSISQTQAFLTRGMVGLCTSKLVAGSHMTYSTPHGSVNIRGRKVVIETNYEMTKISMLEGDATVRAGQLDSGGHVLSSGDQAIIRRGQDGRANQIEIRRIPKEETAQMDDKVAMACLARKTVYFDVREKRPGTQDDDSAAGSGPLTPRAGSTFSPVTAFDGNANFAGNREIVPVEILSPILPVEHTVSNANLPSTAVR